MLKFILAILLATSPTVLAASGVMNIGSNVTGGGGGGSGTVTSVAQTVPSFLSVAGSPVTTSGTLAISLVNQAINTVFAGPSSGGSAAPTFRALVPDDLTINGTSGQILETNGAGVFSWVTPSGAMDWSFPINSDITADSDDAYSLASITEALTAVWALQFRSNATLTLSSGAGSDINIDPGAGKIRLSNDLIFLLAGILQTQEGLGQGSNIITVKSGDADTTGSGEVYLSSGNATAPNVGSGGVNIASGNVSGTGISGNININSGTVGAGTGTSGNISLSTPGGGAVQGYISFENGSEGTIGHVWTSISIDGKGEWAAFPSSGVLPNDTFYQIRNFANTADVDIFKLDTDDVWTWVSGPAPTEPGELDIGSQDRNFNNVWAGQFSWVDQDDSSKRIISFVDTITTNWNMVLPSAIGTTGQVLTIDSITGGDTAHLKWLTSGAGDFATRSLNNLTSPTNINQDLIFNTGANANIQTKDGVGAASRFLFVGSGFGAAGFQSGAVIVTSGGSDTGTGNTALVSGTTSADDAPSGEVNVISGNTSGTGTSGTASMFSGTAAGTGNSGTVLLQSGNSSGGNSGNINLVTGTAGSARGSVSVDAPRLTILNHLHSGGPSPTANVDANAGTGATCSVTGIGSTDIVGHVSIVQGADAVTGIQCSITFNSSYSNSPVCVLSPTTSSTALNMNSEQIFVTATPSDLQINIGATVGSNTFELNYHCIEPNN